jgi:Glycosyltransferase family 87
MPNATNTTWWLTARRLRVHAAILACCLWGLYGWDMSSPGLHDRAGNLKGTDFLHFYTLGSLALEHRGGALYDLDVQAALAARRVPEATGIRYLPLYPPQVSIFFAPFARLSYRQALIAWLAVNTLIYALCTYFLWRGSAHLQGAGRTAFLLAAAFPPFFHLIAWGQTSGLALACFTLAFFALQSQRNFWAGLALGSLIFKPQLGLASAAIFILTGEGMVIAGAVASAVGQMSLALLYYGPAPLREWTHMLLRVREFLPLLEPKPSQTHSLRTFWDMVIPWPQFSFYVYLLTACIVLAITVDMWRKDKSSSFALRYCSLLLTTILIAPHLTVYDLVILSPVFVLLADWIKGQRRTARSRRFGGLLYLAYLSPLLGPLDQWTHLQISVIAMAALLFMIWRAQTSASEIGFTPIQSIGEPALLSKQEN